jgi:hypothetical protein
MPLKASIFSMNGSISGGLKLKEIVVWIPAVTAALGLSQLKYDEFSPPYFEIRKGKFYG